MTFTQELQDVIKKWTPVTCTPPLQNEPYVANESCVVWRTEAKKIPKIGDVNGGLEVIEYTNNPSEPIAVKCVCGRTLPVSIDDFYNNGTCGCFQNAVNIAYLIRFRIELLRTWFIHMGAWLQDLNTVSEYVNLLLDQNSAMAGEVFKVGVNKQTQVTSPTKLRREGVSETNYMFLQFLGMVKPSGAYRKYLERISKSVQMDFPLWEGNLLAWSNDTDGQGAGIPEFDRQNFKAFMKFLKDNKEGFASSSSDILDKEKINNETPLQIQE